MTTATLEVRYKGGPGSGNWGHAGRPGFVGGSAPKTGVGAAMSIRTGRTAATRQRHTKFIAQTSSQRLESYGKVENPGVTPSRVVVVEGVGKAIMKKADRGYLGQGPGERGLEAEVEVYSISEQLGWGLVPATNRISLEKEIDEGFEVGTDVTVQEWIGDTKVIRDFNRYTDVIDKRSLSRITLLDIVSGNVDRHNENIIIHKETGKAYAIDNNRSFWKRTADRNLRRIIEHYPEQHWANVVGQYNLAFNIKDVEAVHNLVSSVTFRRHISDTYGQDVLDGMAFRWGEFITGWRNRAESGEYNEL